MDEARAEPRSTYSLAIVLSDSGDLIGGCGLISQRAHYQEFEVSYCLRRDAWRQGFGSEAVGAAVEFGFEPAYPHGIYCRSEELEPAFMGVALAPGSLDGYSGRVEYHPAFSDL